MSFDLGALLDAHRGEAYPLHDRYLNPQLAKVLTTLGFDRTYVRGEGAYLIDDRAAARSTSSPGSASSPWGAATRW